MRKGKIIFVGGIHGVGKSTLCKKISEELNLEHLSASDLINEGKNTIMGKLVDVKDVDKNQVILLEMLDKYCSYDKFYLLDGHFCLLNKDNGISYIPEKIFDAISPHAMITLHHNAENILRHLLSRDKKRYNLELIKKFQEQELDYSDKISSLYKIINIKEDPIENTDYIIEQLKTILGLNQ